MFSYLRSIHHHHHTQNVDYYLQISFHFLQLGTVCEAFLKTRVLVWPNKGGPWHEHHWFCGWWPVMGRAYRKFQSVAFKPIAPLRVNVYLYWQWMRTNKTYILTPLNIWCWININHNNWKLNGNEIHPNTFHKKLQIHFSDVLLLHSVSMVSNANSADQMRFSFRYSAFLEAHLTHLRNLKQ